jgi:hypothetical protein
MAERLSIEEIRQRVREASNQLASRSAAQRKLAKDGHKYWVAMLEQAERDVGQK